MTAAHIAEMVRVDHAGECGAVRIYEGQLAILEAIPDPGPGKREAAATVRGMLAEERHHKERFDALLLDRRVRPTLLAPVWDAAGFALGAVTALMGERAAMACTAAVEEEIDAHYAAQLRILSAMGESERELHDTIADFREDELAHRDQALAAGAALTPGYGLLNGAIRAGCRAAIALSRKI